ncbi:hypothetical protein PIB30_095410, partial [Stylosanthes scabra]|nr:hypothetical protein [Stylosanthes scabra]
LLVFIVIVALINLDWSLATSYISQLFTSPRIAAIFLPNLTVLQCSGRFQIWIFMSAWLKSFPPNSSALSHFFRMSNEFLKNQGPPLKTLSRFASCWKKNWLQSLLKAAPWREAHDAVRTGFTTLLQNPRRVLGLERERTF